MINTDHNKPVFSIITITFNHLKGLRSTHQSLQEQSCRDYEWIVIDGGSHDGTQDYMAGIEAVFISEPDHGIYDAMNKGIDRARGDYLLFLNAGDCLAAPDILETLAHIPNADFIYGDALEEIDVRMIGDLDSWKEKHVQSSGHPTIRPSQYKPARSHIKILQGMITHHQAMLYRREVMEDLRYDITYKIAADYKFTVQFLQRATHSHYYPHPICVFECGGVSQQNVRQGRREQFQIRRDLNVCGPVQNSLIYIRQALSSLLKRLFPFIYWRLRG